MLHGTEEALYKAEQLPVNSDSILEPLPNEDLPLAFEHGFVQKTRIIQQRKREKTDNALASVALAKAITSSDVTSIVSKHITSVREKIEELNKTDDSSCSSNTKSSGNNGLNMLALDYNSSDSELE